MNRVGVLIVVSIAVCMVCMVSVIAVGVYNSSVRPDYSGDILPSELSAPHIPTCADSVRTLGNEWIRYNLPLDGKIYLVIQRLPNGNAVIVGEVE